MTLLTPLYSLTVLIYPYDIPDEGDSKSPPIRQNRSKAKATGYDMDDLNQDGGMNGDDNNNNSAPVSFPPGQHPLQNVPNCMELSAPEALRGKSREVSESTGIISLVGEYRASCLFSKAWILREAATQKIQIMLTEGR